MTGIYLMFDGKCRDALNLYEKAFNVKATAVQKYGDMPSTPDFHVRDNEKELILHSRLAIDGMEIMCSDNSRGTISGDNMYITITAENNAKGEEFVKNAWNVFKESGTVYMELQQTFFAVCHGSLKDKFGVNWMFSVLK